MLKLLQNTDHWYNCEFRMRLCKDILSVMLKTRMHSSRMRTAYSSSRRGVSFRHPPRDQAPPPREHPRSRHPSDQAPPVDRHTPVNILNCPNCPKLRLRAVNIVKRQKSTETIGFSSFLTHFTIFLDLLMAHLIFFTRFQENFSMFNLYRKATLISLTFTEYQIYTEKRKNSI